MWEYGLNRAGSGQGKVAGACECGNEPSGSIKCGEFLDQMQTCQLLKKDSPVWSKYVSTNFDVLLAVLHLSVFISVFNQLDAQNLFDNKFYFMPVHVSSTCAHHQEVKIALHSLWYHHTQCDDTRCARNMQRHEIKLIVKQTLCIKLVKY